MRRDAPDAQVSHELAGVVAPVSAEVYLVRPLERSAHPHRAIPFSLGCDLVTSLATTRPFQFSMTQWLMKIRNAPTPGALLNKRASSSLVERWV